MVDSEVLSNLIPKKAHSNCFYFSPINKYTHIKKLTKKVVINTHHIRRGSLNQSSMTESLAKQGISLFLTKGNNILSSYACL